MPIPVNIVIPADMGSNIVGGSTVSGAQSSDINRWIATIDKNGMLVYPRMSSAADFGSPAAVDDDRIVSAGLLPAAGSPGSLAAKRWRSSSHQRINALH